jgi:hypothetical protein
MVDMLLVVKSGYLTHFCVGMNGASKCVCIDGVCASKCNVYRFTGMCASKCNVYRFTGMCASKCNVYRFTGMCERCISG